jgi:hypothetical protein
MTPIRAITVSYHSCRGSDGRHHEGIGAANNKEKGDEGSKSKHRDGRSSSSSILGSNSNGMEIFFMSGGTSQRLFRWCHRRPSHSTSIAASCCLFGDVPNPLMDAPSAFDDGRADAAAKIRAYNTSYIEVRYT